MLLQLKSYAFATQKQCFPTLEDMLSSKGIHAFWARKLYFKKVEEKWKMKSSLPPHVIPLYKGVSEEKVEVEGSMQKNYFADTSHIQSAAIDDSQAESI